MPSSNKSSRTLVTALILLPLLLGAVGLWVLERGRAELEDGEACVARITRTQDGRCWVGAKRQHCYKLTFEVYAKGEPSFITDLDVNVEDQWSSRVQPGAFVWVVRDREAPRRVALAIDAFSDLPPPDPR